MNRWKLAVCGTALVCLACGSLSVDQAPASKAPSTIATSVGPAIHISPIDHPVVLPQGGGQNLVGTDHVAPLPKSRPPSGETAPPNILPAEPIASSPCSGGNRVKIMCPVAAP